MTYPRYTGTEAPVPAPEHYDSSAMTLLAYAARRTIGAVIVFMLVVLLLQLAIDSINLSPLR